MQVRRSLGPTQFITLLQTVPEKRDVVGSRILALENGVPTTGLKEGERFGGGLSDFHFPSQSWLTSFDNIRLLIIISLKFQWWAPVGVDR